MSEAKVELGRYLFYDTRLSFNGKESCATCHKQTLAFTDGRAHAEGTTGQLHPRSSMSLVNVAYATSLTWANPALTSLEEQALGPMLNDDPIELGLKGHEAAVVAWSVATGACLSPETVSAGFSGRCGFIHADERYEGSGGI